mmetsp:Transcript_9919/g.23262  ORF Transcript_9919/g.23262 Transcript_9919/m.23262 type:complete len:203 (-) Transcript_9919:1259-1867(-)
MACAAILQVVAVHAGDDDVLELQRRNRLGQVQRLVHVQRVRAAVAHVAEGAAAGALVAHDHEGRRALAEALADVGAAGLLADGVQLVLAQDLLDLVEARARRTSLDADPLGLLQHFGRHDLDRDARGLGLGLLLDRRVVSRVGHGQGVSCATSRSASRPAAVDQSVKTPILSRDVVSRPSYPHGLMRAKGSRSIATLSARPW